MTCASMVKAFACLTLVVGASMATGCHKASAWAEPAVGGRDRRGAYETHFGYESLAMDSAKLRAANQRAVNQGDGGAEIPWYAVRNDMKPSTLSGSAVAPVYERSITFTNDHQYISGSHVSDHYSQHTYRVRVQGETNR